MTKCGGCGTTCSDATFHSCSPVNTLDDAYVQAAVALAELYADKANADSYQPRDIAAVQHSEQARVNFYNAGIRFLAARSSREGGKR